jgi:hypothetical protein
MARILNEGNREGPHVEDWSDLTKMAVERWKRQTTSRPRCAPESKCKLRLNSIKLVLKQFARTSQKGI